MILTLWLVTVILFYPILHVIFGMIFDKCMKLDYHISSVCKSTYFHLRNIGGIRNILSNAQLIHSLVTVRLDYCNSILYGFHDNSLYRLQKIQNTAARILARLPRFSHISATLLTCTG